MDTGNKTIELKAIIDEALEKCPSVSSGFSEKN
jgi:hypothetical protein